MSHDVIMPALGMAQDSGLPVHIAVIPDLLEPSLPPAFDSAPSLIPVVHG